MGVLLDFLKYTLDIVNNIVYVLPKLIKISRLSSAKHENCQQYESKASFFVN